MTQEKLKQAEELNIQIRKISFFLSYIDRDNYKTSIRLDNENENGFHSEVLHLKNNDELIDIIKKNVENKMQDLKEQFDKL